MKSRCMILRSPNLSCSDSLRFLTDPNCFIEHYNSGVEHLIGCGEKRCDVLSIVREFIKPMREGVHCGSNSLLPSDCPVSTIHDRFGGLNHSKRDFEIFDCFGLNVIVGGHCPS
jgi:hypothetical protein